MTSTHRHALPCDVCPRELITPIGGFALKPNLVAVVCTTQAWRYVKPGTTSEIPAYRAKRMLDRVEKINVHALAHRRRNEPAHGVCHVERGNHARIAPH